MNATKQSRTIVSPLFLFSCTFLTIFAIAAILYSYSGLAYQEQPIELLKTVPTQEDSAAETVNVGLYIDNFYTFDVLKDEFMFDGTLTFQYDPKLISLEELGKTSFESGEIKYISEPAIYEENGLHRAYYHLRVKFVANLTYGWFPFEDHRISVVLINRVFKPAKIAFEVNEKAFTAPDMSFKGWHKFGTWVQTGYQEEQLAEGSIYYPAAVFNIAYGRYTNVRNIFMILLPMIMLFFTALFSLIIDPRYNFTFVLTFPVSAIAGLISFRFVVEAMSPKVGYFMYSDYFFILFLCLIFCILIFHTFGYNFGSTIRKIMIAGFDFIVVLLCFILIYRIDSLFQK